MNRQIQTEIDSLSAPETDGEILIWPRAGELRGMAEANQGRRDAFAFSVLDRPAREWLEREAVPSPIFMTGHQPEFFHPGVWAKNVVATALARRSGGTPRFLVVDSDVPRRVAIRWPDVAGDGCRLRSTDAGSHLEWLSYEHFSAENALDYDRLFAGISEPSHDGSASLLSVFRTGFADAAAAVRAGDAGYVDRWMAGMRSVDRALNEPPHGFVGIGELFSERSESCPPSASAFAAHIVLEAERFAAAYNAALAAYRRRRGIRGRQHPIPDLAVEAGRVELPFWVLHTSSPRERLTVARTHVDGVELRSGKSVLCSFSRTELRREPTRIFADLPEGCGIRPRALAQTMYARLFACDLFIHGIGGAKYDQITDDVIRAFFDVEPPSFASVSATLWLPLPRYDVTESDLQAGRRKMRDLRYNPQRYVAGAGQGSGFDELLVEREAAIRDSAGLKIDRPRDRIARRTAFDRIHRANAALLRTAPGLSEEAGRQVIEMGEKLAHDRIAKSREWFFALYSKTQLERLGRQLRREIGA